MNTHNETFRRVARTSIQLIAAGGLTYAIDYFAADIPTGLMPMLLSGNMLVTTWAQNYAEQRRWIPAILKTDPTAQALAEAAVLIRKKPSGATHIAPPETPTGSGRL